MTTENTDAATRILTKTIRKLTKRLQIADQVLARQEAVSGSVARSMTRLTGDNRQDLAATHRRIMEPGVYLEELAEKRMAELAESQKARQWVEGRLKSALCGADELRADVERAVAAHAELRARIDKALARLGECPNDVSDILRGER